MEKKGGGQGMDNVRGDNRKRRSTHCNASEQTNK